MKKNSVTIVIHTRIIDETGGAIPKYMKILDPEIEDDGELVLPVVVLPSEYKVEEYLDVIELDV